MILVCNLMVKNVFVLIFYCNKDVNMKVNKILEIFLGFFYGKIYWR